MRGRVGVGWGGEPMGHPLGSMGCRAPCAAGTHSVAAISLAEGKCMASL